MGSSDVGYDVLKFTVQKSKVFTIVNEIFELGSEISFTMRVFANCNFRITKLIDGDFISNIEVRSHTQYYC